jgi:hypothetical protein
MMTFRCSLNIFLLMRSSDANGRRLRTFDRLRSDLNQSKRLRAAVDFKVFQRG